MDSFFGMISIVRVLHKLVKRTVEIVYKDYFTVFRSTKGLINFILLSIRVVNSSLGTAALKNVVQLDKRVHFYKHFIFKQ